jgi:hypothetical protein
MASDESRALFQRLVDGTAASVRRQLTTERRGEKLRSSALLILGFVALWWAVRYVAGPTSAVRRAMEAPRAQATASDAAGARVLSPGVESPETFGQIPSATMLRTRASIDEGTAKAAKARQRQFLYTVEDVVQAIADADAKRKSFEATVQELMVEDAGKRIAATQRGVPLFLAIVERERIPATRLSQLSQLLETIAEPVRKAHGQDQNFAVPGDEQERLLTQIKNEAGRAHSGYAEAVDDLAALKRDAGLPNPTANGTGFPTPAVKTLRDAADDYRLGLRTSSIRERERRLDEQRKANEERAAQAEVERERAKGKAEEDRLLQEVRALEERARVAARAKEAEAERRRLITKAREPGVRQSLTPFLTRGFIQPKAWQGSWLAIERTAEEKPVSLMALRSLGALEPSAKGLESLAWVAGDVKVDRPRWAFGHINTWTADTHRYVAGVQALLRELGDVLVEEGMLSK